MSMNFTRLLRDMNYQAVIDKAISAIEPKLEVEHEKLKHLVRNVIITTHLTADETEDKKLPYGPGIEVSFELQNPVPRKEIVFGVKAEDVFIRQYIAFIPENEIPRRLNIPTEKKTFRERLGHIFRYLFQID